jgi:hypothetical protein
MAETDPRLATRISPDNDKRLRLTALVRRVHLRDVLDELLGAHLPTADELAGRIRNGDTDDRTS